MAQDAYVEFLLEMMQGLEGATSRKMFGGHGIYLDGLMFGLVADDTLYLKVDDESLPEFEARELGPFVYHKAGKPMAMSYHLAPPEALEEPDQMTLWAGKAVDAALREARKKAGRGERKTTGKSAKKKTSGPVAKKTVKRVGKKIAKKAAAKRTAAKKKFRKASGSGKKAATKKTRTTKKKTVRGRAVRKR